MFLRARHFSHHTQRQARGQPGWLERKETVWERWPFRKFRLCGIPRV